MCIRSEPGRPPDEEERIGEILGPATQFDRLVPKNFDPIPGRLTLEERLKVGGRLDHSHFRQRKALVDEGVLAIREWDHSGWISRRTERLKDGRNPRDG